MIYNNVRGSRNERQEPYSEANNEYTEWISRRRRKVDNHLKEHMDGQSQHHRSHEKTQTLEGLADILQANYRASNHETNSNWCSSTKESQKLQIASSILVGKQFRGNLLEEPTHHPENNVSKRLKEIDKRFPCFSRGSRSDSKHDCRKDKTLI